MEWYESEVRALEREWRDREASGGDTVFYGSSSIRLWTSLASDLRDNRALNLGFGGSTLAACVHFFDRLIPPTKPASIVVYAGDNDLGDGRSPEDVLASFRTLAGQVKSLGAGHVPLGFLSIKPSPARAGIMDRIMRANQMVRAEIAGNWNRDAYFVDLFEAMLGRDGFPRKELFLEDGLHLSPAGYQEWVRLLEPYRNQIFIESSR